MIPDDEVESYATSFATEIRKQFDGDVRAAAGGLAKLHGYDSQVVEHIMWQGISEDLGASPEPDVCYVLDEEE
jgi:hypothetical protein